ncbi:MAG: DISARM system helicase DrmA, partial [Planctomycetales bacterium]
MSDEQQKLKEAVPSPLTMREMLETMAIKELLGPVGGDEEEVDERIRDRYLVGILAPQPRDESVDQDDGAAASVVEIDEGDDTQEGDYPPGDELAIEGVGRGSASGDDGPTELSAPQSKAIFPSSIGMSFCVDLDAKSLKVTPKFGWYDRVPSEYLTTKTGKPKKVWKRVPGGGTPHDIPLKAGSFGPVSIDPAFQDADIRGLIRRRSNHWSVTIFLMNGGFDLPTGIPNRERLWMFQCEMEVEAPDGASIFHKRLSRIDLPGTDKAYQRENDMLAMQYRRHVEFAVGHGVAVHTDVDPSDTNRALRISSRAVPSYEIPKTTPPTVDDADQNPAFAKLDGLVLDMKELYDAPQSKLGSMLEPLLVAYEEWIRLEKAKITDPAEDLADYQEVAQQAIASCERTLERIREGIDLVVSDSQVFEAFSFMNHSMWLQRTRSLFSEGVRRGKDIDYNDVDIPVNRSWYPFQLAFILLNLPGVAKLDHPDRSESEDALADLLWFPTGGGKTEAYLGLTAFTLGIRRLQGTVEGRSGEYGVAVLMRYTLRLLTLQQFQRATALICACEIIRREAESKKDLRWGKTPFRIGLWVGAASTPNRTANSEEALKLAVGSGGGGRRGAIGGSGSPHQLTNCPWCGSKIDFTTRFYQIETEKKGRGRT